NAPSRVANVLACKRLMYRASYPYPGTSYPTANSRSARKPGVSRFARLLAWTCWACQARSTPLMAVKISLSMSAPLHRLHQRLDRLVRRLNHLGVGLVITLGEHQVHQFGGDIHVGLLQHAHGQRAHDAAARSEI